MVAVAGKCALAAFIKAFFTLLLAILAFGNAWMNRRFKCTILIAS